MATLFAQSTISPLKIAHLTSDFYVYTTHRMLKGTPFPANGLYLVTDSGVVIIDSPWDTTQFQPLLDSIEIKHHKKVVMCLATHSHEDRTGGLAYYRQQGIKTYTSKQTALICKARNEKLAEFVIDKDTIFRVGQYTFQTYYGGAGHTSDNIVVWFERDKILYGGCLVKSVEAADLGNLADADIKQWPNTIKNILKKFGKPDYVIPGHQDWTNNNALAHTLKLLKQHGK